MKQTRQAYADENAGVLACEVVWRLAKVHGRIALLLVEVEELLCQAEADTNPLHLTPRPLPHMQPLTLAVIQTHQQRWQVLARFHLLG